MARHAIMVPFSSQFKAFKIKQKKRNTIRIKPKVAVVKARPVTRGNPFKRGLRPNERRKPHPYTLPMPIPRPPKHIPLPDDDFAEFSQPLTKAAPIKSSLPALVDIDTSTKQAGLMPSIGNMNVKKVVGVLAALALLTAGAGYTYKKYKKG